MHPLSSKTYTNSTEIEDRILELNKKYFMTGNPDVQLQISMMIDTLRLSLEELRMEEKRIQQENNGSEGLDNLINVS